MGTQHPHLFRRQAVYYWRRRLPAAVGKLLARTQLVRSLGTRCPQLARRRARRLSARIDDLYESVQTMAATGKRPPTKADLDQILLDIFHEILEVGEINRTARPEGYLAEEVEEEWFGPHGDSQFSAPEWNRLEARTLLKINGLRMAEPAVKERLEARGLAKPDDPGEYRQLLRGALVSMAAAHDIEYDREQGRYYPAVHPLTGQQPVAGLSMTSSPSAAARKTLSEAFEGFVEHKMRERAWTTKSRDQAVYALKLWCQLMGDRPFAEINKADAREFRARLCDLPKMSGRGHYSELSADRASEVRRELESKLQETGAKLVVGRTNLSREEAERFAEPIGPKTVNRHLTYFSDFFGWKIELGAYGLPNPFKGALFAKREVQRKAQRRKLWDASALEGLFRSPQWTGSKSEYYRSQPGEWIYEDIRFWAPLLSLYTGMREGEICALRCTDVTFDREAGAWTVRVTEGKTENAKRTIPLHSKLVDLGFLDFLEAVQKAGHSYLFLGSPEQVDIAKEAEKVSKWFTQYRKAVGLYEEARDFHALRHTFRTALSRGFKGDTLLARSLMGHSGAGEIDEVYFHGYRPMDTVEVVEQLDFGVDLSHLLRDRQPGRLLQIPQSTARKAKRRSRQAAPSHKREAIAAE